MLAFVYEKDNNCVFLEYESVLVSVFTCKSIKLGDTYLQMSKQTFIEIMDSIGLLIMPKKKSADEEKKEKEARDKLNSG